jgi:hypothetical protein
MVMVDSVPKRLRPAPSVHTRLFDGELVILDLDRGEYLALDPIGSALWTGLEKGRTVDEVAEEIATDYDVSLETARSDLEELAREFLNRGLFIESHET